MIHVFFLSIVNLNMINKKYNEVTLLNLRWGNFA